MDQSPNQGSFRPLTKWLAEMGVGSITGWRWRNRGWLKTVAIANKHYVSDLAIADFNRRLESGEFAKLQNPKRHKKSTRKPDAVQDAS